MRILHVSTRLILGGSQENTVLSCEGQARLGHDVHLAFGPIYGPEGSLLERVEKFRTADGRKITTHVMPHLVREIRPATDRLCEQELGRLIYDLEPDIVHTHSSKAGILGRAAAWPLRHGFKPILQPPPMIASARWDTGIVHTIHGPPFMPTEGSLLRQTRVRFNNWVYTRAERFAAKRCHLIVSVADAMTREFLARGIGRAEQYVTVRSGMEVEPYLTAAPGWARAEVRRDLGLAEDDFVVGTVARLAEHKGHDDLLDALGEDLKRNANLKLLWVGDGWWAQRLKEKAAAMGIRTRGVNVGPHDRHPRAQLILTGLVPPDRIPGLLRAMDVLAHPSYREGLPRTVPQALLCGVCPVAYDCDGTGEVCREMETGRLVPTGDKERLRDAILWLRDHPRERTEMAARGREKCRAAFSAETMVAELEKVYARATEIARKA